MKALKRTFAVILAAAMTMAVITVPAMAEQIRGLTFTAPMDLDKYKLQGYSSPWLMDTGWADDNGILKTDEWIEYVYTVKVQESPGSFYYYHPEEIWVKCIYDKGIYSINDLNANGWLELYDDVEYSSTKPEISNTNFEKHNGVDYFRMDYTLNGLTFIRLYAPSESGDVFSIIYKYSPSTGIAQQYEQDFWDMLDTVSLRQKSSSSSTGENTTPAPQPTAAPAPTETHRGGKTTTVDDDGNTIVEYLWDDAIKIYVNNDRVTPDSNPIIANDRTLVPIRVVAEKLGYSVNWFGDSQTVSMQKGSDLVQLSIGSKSLYHNSSNIIIDVAPMIYNDRTYLPVRAVGEAMGASVNWNGSENAVYITK